MNKPVNLEKALGKDNMIARKSLVIDHIFCIQRIVWIIRFKLDLIAIDLAHQFYRNFVAFLDILQVELEIIINCRFTWVWGLNRFREHWPHVKFRAPTFVWDSKFLRNIILVFLVFVLYNTFKVRQVLRA